MSPTMTPQSTGADPSNNTPSRPAIFTSHTYSHSLPSSYTSSPDSRPFDLRHPILEEDGEESSSAAANSPITPLDPLNAQILHQKIAALEHANIHAPTPIHPPVSLPTSTAHSPKSKSNPKTPNRRQDGTSKDSVERPGPIKRAFSGFFRRTNSQNNGHHGGFVVQPVGQVDGTVLSTAINNSDPTLSKDPRRMFGRKGSATDSGATTRSNTPPVTPPSPTNVASKTPIQGQEASTDRFPSHGRRKAPTFSLRDKFSKPKIAFAPPEHPTEHRHSRHRSTSADLNGLNPQLLGIAMQSKGSTGSDAELPQRQIWGMAADSGTGLKSRRLSLSLPDNFFVDCPELYSEYCDRSKLIGRRGKSIGKGATASVKLMNKKGGSAGEVYAVKEFRGKSSNEKAEDYEKKVKSEYSIAKSLHHPNIVETFRLCTYNGRWNQVMEFCDQGDLFSLVSQKYLSKDDHLSDRVCMFKQLVQGLNYLHQHGIAHRDVKLENLLVTKDSKLKITDFGVSEVFAGIHPGLREAGGQCGKAMGEIRLCAPGMCGSPPYVAPEVIAKNGEYDPRPLDVWGAAIVMLCMCAGGVLWNEAKPGASPRYDELIKGWAKWNSKHENAEDCPNEIDYPHVGFFDQFINPPALRRILLTMLNPDPSKRATMATVAKNRWLRGQDCCQVDSYDDPATVIDASKTPNNMKSKSRVVHHNHLPPSTHIGHKVIRLPGSTDM